MRFPIALLLIVLAPALSAQVFVSTPGASCVSIPASGTNHVITLSQPVPAGSALLIAAGTTKNATMGNPQVTDNRGNVYTSTMSRIHPTNFDLRTFTVITPVTTSLQAGDQVTLHYIAADVGGETSCASLSRFDALTVSTPVSTDVAVGNDTTNVMAHSLSTGVTPFATLLLFESAVISGTHGGIGANPGNPLTLACNGANNFCVLPAYRIVSTTGNYTMTVNTTNNVKGTLAMVSYRGIPLLFKNSFE